MFIPATVRRSPDGYSIKLKGASARLTLNRDPITKQPSPLTMRLASEDTHAVAAVCAVANAGRDDVVLLNPDQWQSLVILARAIDL